MNIVEVIKKETLNFRKKIAVIEKSRSISYSELFEAVDISASALKNFGILPSERVALICEDSIEYIIISLAVLSINAVLVPVSTALSKKEIKAVLDRIQINHLIFENTRYEKNDDIRILSNEYLEREIFLYRCSSNDNMPVGYYKIGPAFIRFSSGTTGASKGVVLSHRSILERTDAADKGLQITSDDVVVWVLSMSFHFVVTILLFLRRSSTIILSGKKSFPEYLEEGLKVHSGTFIYASPFHYQMLINNDKYGHDLLSGVRIAVSTAMKQPVSAAQAFYEKFGLELTEAYGLIEAGLPFINFSNNAAKRGSVGKILPDYRLKIVNPDAEDIGEIHIKGKGFFDAYFSPWQAREKIMSDGWFYTGDLGRVDNDGYLFLAGRGKNVINFAGMKIFPYEVESVINQHPCVKESVVYGVDHSRFGELPCVEIVVSDKNNKNPALLRNEIHGYCRRYLASYKVPKEFKFVSKLSRTYSGKIKRW